MIYEYSHIYREDIEAILRNFNVTTTKGSAVRQKVCLTGTRDETITNALIEHGYDVSEGGVTKDTVMLIAKDKNSGSSKLKKAKQLNIPIYSIDEIIELLNIKL